MHTEWQLTMGSEQKPVLFLCPHLERVLATSTRNYRQVATGKTAKSILVSCGARLAPFDIAELGEITSYDELELDTLGDRKTALFLI